MKLTYYLSNRQMKELVIRNTPLWIAIPIPLDLVNADSSGDRAYVESVLDPSVVHLIKEVKLRDVCVAAWPIRTGCFGMIFEEGRPPDRPFYTVSVFAVLLSPVKPLNPPVKLQFPAKTQVGINTYTNAGEAMSKPVIGTSD